ncbi:uncharacterized protein LOC121401523 isoform X1 [Xenopus laevis]|uniref:Uncharacterized protein LOC121401523 isoform X1 n=1 Tax=Xenopus laevis TaxID=8355 RepID=A0A8J1ML84_XENLA|nr:uncharacterized protein LOC121401523 isoform X1 [Xenopus laevis]
MKVWLQETTTDGDLTLRESCLCEGIRCLRYTIAVKFQLNCSLTPFILLKSKSHAVLLYQDLSIFPFTGGAVQWASGVRWISWTEPCYLAYQKSQNERSR